MAKRRIPSALESLLVSRGVVEKQPTTIPDPEPKSALEQAVDCVTGGPEPEPPFAALKGKLEKAVGGVEEEVFDSESGRQYVEAFQEAVVRVDGGAMPSVGQAETSFGGKRYYGTVLPDTVWTFDDQHIGLACRTSRVLQFPKVDRPSVMSRHEWYEFAGKLCMEINNRERDPNLK